jgi:hypothetical protein
MTDATKSKRQFNSRRLMSIHHNTEALLADLPDADPGQ